MTRAERLNSANASEGSGGSKFKEGFVRVEASKFMVHQNRERKNNDGSVTPGEIKLALVWAVTRLDEDQNPLQDEHGEDLQEDLVFGLGGGALVDKNGIHHAHVGYADSPDTPDEDIQDQGCEVGTEGPTVYFVDGNFIPSAKSAYMVLHKSLSNVGWKADYDRGWAPDYVGSVFSVKGVPTEMEDRATGKKTTYDAKIVDKIVKAGYEVKGGGKAAAKTGKSVPAAAKSGKESGADAVAESKPAAAEKTDKSPSVAETALKPILQKISEHYDGQRFTRKALVTKVNMALQNGKVEDSVTGKVEPKLHVPVMSLLKDDKWMTTNSLPKSGDYDMTYDAEAGTVTFGTFKEDEG